MEGKDSAEFGKTKPIEDGNAVETGGGKEEIIDGNDLVFIEDKKARPEKQQEIPDEKPDEPLVDNPTE